MSRLRIVTVVGARPQFVKAAAVSRAIARWNDRAAGPLVVEELVHTGQHYDERMSAVFFDELGMAPPTEHLGVGSAPHGAQTGEMMKRLEPVVGDLEPAVVLAYGDTNSTLAAALVAAKLRIPFAHVEAGLRSFNRAMPEEVNRVVADHLADFLFCPSATAADNLAAEGITDGVTVVGDVMHDALRWALPPDDERAAMLARHGLTAGEYALATVHRAENTDDPERIDGIITGLGLVAADRPVVVPLHPRTAAVLGGRALPPGVRTVDPVGHREMLALASGATIGLTDSGGLQKELYWLGVPCVTLRDETEWVETVSAGWNIVAGCDPAGIAAAVRGLLGGRRGERPAVYGDGDAAERVVAALAAWDGAAAPAGAST